MEVKDGEGLRVAAPSSRLSLITVPLGQHEAPEEPGTWLRYAARVTTYEPMSIFSIAARAASSWPDAVSGGTRTFIAMGGGREHVPAGTSSAEARRIKEAHRRLEQRYAVHRVLRSTSNLSSARRTVEATEAATWTLEALLSRVGPLRGT